MIKLNNDITGNPNLLFRIRRLGGGGGTAGEWTQHTWSGTRNTCLAEEAEYCSCGLRDRRLNLKHHDGDRRMNPKHKTP